MKVAMGIGWDENEAEKSQLEHIGCTTISNNLVTVKRGMHWKLPWEKHGIKMRLNPRELEHIGGPTINI